MKRNKIFTTVAALLACAVAHINISCVDDTDIQNSKAGVDKNAIVVNTMTEQFENNETPDAKCTRVMDVQTSDGYTLKLMEIDYNFMDEPTQEQAGVATRGKMIESANDVDINTVGIYGYAAADNYNAIGTVPNVVDNGYIDTDGYVKKNGSIKYWSPAISYAQFAAVYPRVENNGQVSEFARKDAGKFTLGCNLPQDCKQQKDLMFGYVQPKKYENKTAPQTTIALKHALTAINFAVGDNLTLGKKIDRIQLEDAGSSATCVAEVQAGGVTRMEWTDKQGAAKGTYRLRLSTPVATNTPNVIITGGEKGKRDDNTFFVIPRKEKAQDVNITVYYTDKTKMKVTIPKDQFKGWEPGHTITYMLTGKSNMNKILADQNRLELTKEGRKIKNESASFNIKSYKFAKGTKEGDLKQGENAVAKAWKVVSYKYKENGKDVTVDKNPDWFTLDKTKGEGGVTNETITGTFHSEKIHHDLLKERNERLQKAKRADNKNLAGEDGKENTANSYIISAPGTYRLPLAYGNAIQNGQTAEKTFKVDDKNVFPTHNCNPAETKTYNGHTIKVYEDKEFIDCGWIADKTNGKSTNAYTPAKSKIVWTDIPDAVTLGTISADKHFLNLTISDKIQNGNAVVAAMNEKEEILWSWHLWFTEEQKTVKAGSSDVLSENLGWKYTDWSKDEKKEITVTLQQVDDPNAKTEVTFVRPELATIQGTSPFYQLFRFSPMSHEKTTKINGKTYYYNLESFSCRKLSKYGDNDLKKLKTDLVYPSFGYAIQNPDHAFWNNDINNTGLNYLWTIVKWNNPYFWRGKNGEKMVYDPCPHGYQVPTYQVLNNIKNAIGNQKASDDNVPVFRVDNKEYYLPHCGMFWGGSSGQVTTDQTRYTSSDLMNQGRKEDDPSEYVTREKSLRVKPDGSVVEQTTVNNTSLDPNLGKTGGCIRPMKGN